MAEETQATRQYIFSEQQTRFFFAGSGVLMVATIVGILLLASARPQGGFEAPDRRQYIETVTNAADDLVGGAENADGSVTISIERAIELVAERGVVDPFTVETSE